MPLLWQGFLPPLGHGAALEQVEVRLPREQVLILRRAAASDDGTHERVAHAHRAHGGQAGGHDDPS